MIAAGMLLAAILPLGPGNRAQAFPLPTPPRTSSPSASPTSPGNMLPEGSSLPFILDGTISSATSKAGELVSAHLASALVVGGITVAPAGTPATIRITDASPASNPDIYGYVDIYARAMRLPDGRQLPLRAPASHLDVNVSAGHESTAAVENTIGDIFAPTLLLHVFRKGRNFVLEPGATIRLRTEASLVAESGGRVAIETPAPLVIDAATPNAPFRAVPLATVDPSYRPSIVTPNPAITPSALPT